MITLTNCYMWNVALANIKYNLKNVWNLWCHHCDDWCMQKKLACTNPPWDTGSSTVIGYLQLFFFNFLTWNWKRNSNWVTYNTAVFHAAIVALVLFPFLLNYGLQKTRKKFKEKNTCPFQREFDKHYWIFIIKDKKHEYWWPQWWQNSLCFILYTNVVFLYFLTSLQLLHVFIILNIKMSLSLKIRHYGTYTLSRKVFRQMFKSVHSRESPSAHYKSHLLRSTEYLSCFKGVLYLTQSM